MAKWFIYIDVLESIMEFSKSSYPNEFSGMLFLRGNIVSDIYIIPLTKSNTNSAVIRLDMVPMSFNIKGSVHSHPSGNGGASNADISFFQSKDVNIIVYFPFDLINFKAYNSDGKLMILEPISRKKT